MTRRDRDRLVEEHVRLHGEGLSHRKIAALTGVHHSTVQADLRRWHEAVLADAFAEWPRARRLAWLVAHLDAGRTDYPWTVADSGGPDDPGIRHPDGGAS